MEKCKVRNRGKGRAAYSNIPMVWRIFPTVFFIPVMILVITNFQGISAKDAIVNSFSPFFPLNSETRTTWLALIISTLAIYFVLRPLFHLWNKYREDQEITIKDRNEAMSRFNQLNRIVMIICIGGFMLGGVLGHHEAEDAMFQQFFFLPSFYGLLEAVSMGFFTGVLITMNLENILFPIKKVLLMEPPGVPQRYYSFYKKLIMSILSLMFFLYFQIFEFTTEFIKEGIQMGQFINWSEYYRGNLQFEGFTDHRSPLKQFFLVFELRMVLFTMVTMRIVVMLKQSLKNPITTIDERLSDLAAQNSEVNRRITIINNDEFSDIYLKINELIEIQDKELKTSKDRLSNVIHNAADPIVSFNDEGRIFVFNPAAEKYFGWQKGDVMGHSIRCLFSDTPMDLGQCPERDHTFVLDLLKREMILKRFHGFSADGKPLHFEANLSSTQTPEGKVFTAIFRDITAQMEMEENLKASKDAAERANQLKSEFLANMSHELRTPLNAVLGFTQLLNNDKSLSPGQLDKIRIISNSGEHLLGLINDILDISKIEAGKQEMHPTVFRLKDFMEDLRDMFDMRCKKKGLILDLEMLGELPSTVEGDLGKLRQILINLLGNAVKFTDEGGISMVVGREAGKLRFSIKDTGKGIPQDEIDHILQPFMQSSNTDNEGGTGLGLAISQSYIQMMGGELEIQSILDEGSIFSFSIDLPETDQAVEVKEERGEVLGLKGDIHPKALIVDDKVNNRLVLKEMLEGVGFITMEAENGLQAIERHGELQSDIIFMDIKMPVMDGYEAVMKIKENQKNLPVFALTASAFKHDEKRIFQSGFDGYLAKPFKQSRLYQLIEEKSPYDFHYLEESSDSSVQLDDESWKSALNLSQAASWMEKLDDMMMINDFLAVSQMAVEMEKDESLISLSRVILKLSQAFDEDGLLRILDSWKEVGGRV